MPHRQEMDQSYSTGLGASETQRTRIHEFSTSVYLNLYLSLYLNMLKFEYEKITVALLVWHWIYNSQDAG